MRPGEPHLNPVGAALRLLRHYQAFLQSNCREMRSPEPGHWGVYYTKEQAAHRLWFLINVAVNRRAGLPDERCRKWDADYQREMRFDADRINRAGTQRLLVRVTEISTPGWRQRFAHRLEGAEEWAQRFGVPLRHKRHSPARERLVRLVAGATRRVATGPAVER